VQPHPVNRANTEHYVWGSNCDGWHLLKDAALSVIEEQMAPGTTEILHFHERSRQFFVVLAGEAVMELDGNETRLAARDGLQIRPRTLHRIRNESQDPLQFLVISQPPSHGDRVTARRNTKP
jgi:mannose-6-phosphate isomerase-like protein (cupin superfamily)